MKKRPGVPGSGDKRQSPPRVAPRLKGKVKNVGIKPKKK